MRSRSPRRWATGSSRRLKGTVAAALIAAAPAAASDPATYAHSVVGAMTDNEWGELFDAWGDVKWRNAQQVGGAVAREWPIGRIGFVGVEAQLLRHFGEQTHWELTTPVMIRTPRTEAPVIPSLGYGLGLSLASQSPETEIARTGESTPLLAHWLFEVEFGGPSSAWRPFVRIHHRSHAWQTFAARTGSNAVLAGVRWKVDWFAR